MSDIENNEAAGQTEPTPPPAQDAQPAIDPALPAGDDHDPSKDIENDGKTRKPGEKVEGMEAGEQGERPQTDEIQGGDEDTDEDEVSPDQETTH